jgi:hypothetical protein
MSSTRDPGTDQPLPKAGGALIHDAIISDVRCRWPVTREVEDRVCSGLVDRMHLGIRKYGHPLQAYNGRDAMQDAWEEALDLLAYTGQASMEKPANEELHDLYAKAAGLAQDIAEWRLRHD